MNAIQIGTTGWSYKDWVGSFYEPGTAQGDYLERYGQHFEIVEVDSTFYRPPTDAMVRRWAERTPETFRFALKVPRLITHERVLADCDREMEGLIATVGLLGSKLKSVLLQFGYFNRAAFSGPKPFLDRLDAFLERYAARLPLACEIRNRAWLQRGYFDLLRRHGVAAAVVEHAWLPPMDKLVAQHDVVTGPYAYVRLLGDRSGIERITKSWDQVVVDRTADLRRVAEALRQVAARAEVLVFVNNHYAGHAPESCRALRAAVDADS
jgi:uncharacterized protein YecE (DUF72 family)